MPNHKQTSFSKIPDKWALVRLGDSEIGMLKDGDWILKKYYTSEGVRLLQIGDIGIGSFLDKSNRFISYETAKKLKCTFVMSEEDALISRMPNPIGRACVAPEVPYHYIVAVDITILKVDKENVDRRFIVQTLNTPKILEEAKRLSSGATRSRISRKNLERLLIPLPPLPEQHRIAEILTTADTAIRKVDDAIAKTERLKRGLMQELLTKGIGHVEFEDSEVGRIPGEWQVTTLRTECVVGTGGTPSRKQPEYFGGMVPWVKTTEVNYNIIVETGEYITELGLQNSNAKIYPAGTLIIAMYGQGVTRGKCAILGVNAAINQACAAIVPKNDNTIHVEYLQYWCQFKYDQIRNLGQGANQSNLNLSVVGSMRFPRPPLLEQHRIAEIISTVDKKLELETKRKEKLGRIKKGLMNDLLTGKRRVKL